MSHNKQRDVATLDKSKVRIEDAWFVLKDLYECYRGKSITISWPHILDNGKLALVRQGEGISKIH